MPEETRSHATLEQEIGQAQAFIRSSQFESAIGLSESLVERYPESGAAWATLGDAYAGSGDWPKAVDFYERALDLSFDRAVMERLAAARRHAIRGDEAVPPAPPIVAPAAPRKARTPPWAIAAVIVGILLIPLLGVLLVRAADGGAQEPDYAPTATDAGVATDVVDVSAPVAPGPVTPSSAIAPAPQGSAAMPTASAPQYRSPVGGTSATPPVQRPQGRRTERAPSAVASDVDQRIMSTLHLERAGAGGLSAKATAMAFDEYAGLGILTISMPSTSDLARLENELLIAAFYAGANAMRTERGLNTLIVRALARVPDDSGREQDIMVFRASVTRPRIERWLSASMLPSPQQIRGEILQDIWWDQQSIARMVQARSRQEGE